LVLLTLIAAEATTVTPTERVTISKHEPDNRFLECAEAANASFLITGNKRHFPKEWKFTQIVNTRELLEIIGSK
jgi:predicted nucleic acid-binding protein